MILPRIMKPEAGFNAVETGFKFMYSELSGENVIYFYSLSGMVSELFIFQLNVDCVLSVLTSLTIITRRRR